MTAPSLERRDADPGPRDHVWTESERAMARRLGHAVDTTAWRAAVVAATLAEWAAEDAA